MTSLEHPRFPRSNAYDPAWLTENPMGAHPLWLCEWITQRVPLERGMRVLDLGCGTAKSSVFLAREFGVQVFATDLSTNATEIRQRALDAGVDDHVIPIHADARDLPFAGEFFDAIVCVDAYNYFGTDDLYLNYLVHFLKPGGHFAFASAGLVEDFGSDVPPHLARFWGADAWTIHAAAWWRHQLSKSGLVDVIEVSNLEDGIELWTAWAVATDASSWYLDALRANGGRHLGYVGAVTKRVAGKLLAEYAWPSTLRSEPMRYERRRMLR